MDELSLEADYDLSLDNSSGNYFSGSLSAITKLTLKTSGIGNTGNSAISIYPNPAHDFLNISISGGNNIGATVTIIDTKGRVVIESQLVSANTKLDISNLMAGIYIISIKTNSRNEISKLIVK